MAGEEVARLADDGDFLPEVVRPKARAIGPVIQSTFAKAYKAGVKIAFGTDCGVSPHGDNHREFVLMAQLGMPPMQVIQSATMEAAKLLRVEKDLGSVESGKYADLVAVRGDPLQDMSILANVAFVMKEGVVYKSELE
jgi:imidazolonepropionase-like amidohydrolase